MTSPPRATVMGLGLFGGGAAAARWLVQQGYQVTVTDLRGPDVLKESLEALADLEIAFRLGEHSEQDFTSANLVVKNPAVRRDNPYIAAAVGAGIPVTTEIALFCRQCPAQLVAITGSNGKTTTTFMVHAILEAASERTTRRAWLGGNLGRSLLGDLGQMTKDDIVVLELSSFQLMDLEHEGVAFPLSAITNITPNHLDWHKDLPEYLRAKTAIFRTAGTEGLVVLNADDPVTAKLGASVTGRWLTYSTQSRGVDAFVDGESARLARGDELFLRHELKLPGQHNVSNALCACLLALEAGATPAECRRALAEMKGIEHRLEYVGTIKDVRYYNDSIATTPESTIAAIQSFHQPIYLLLGGSDKGLDFRQLADAIACAPNIRSLYLNGPVAPKIAAAVHEACVRNPNPHRALSVEHLKTFDEAVERCVKVGITGSVFLMSPSCASFYEFAPGQKFRNFEHRGDHFRELVRRLGSA